MPDGSSTRQKAIRSGLSNEASSSTSGANRSGYGEPSGSSADVRATRLQSATPSGSSSAARRVDPVVAASKTSTQLGSCTAAAGGRSSASSSRSGSGAAAAERSGIGGSTNEWNEFHHAYQGRHWGSEKLRAEYWKFKATGKRPP